ncbi:MAG: sigma-70 family RNA polymerase sigma factor [Phycisphaera sp.]|nr:MAG: sigma-70 family RNA polymerase sigma factor [Phycisphaera sp.]
MEKFVMFSSNSRGRDKGKRTDPKLIASIAAHDNFAAWHEFESWYGPIIQSYCLSRGLPHHEVDDVAQEVYLRISRSTITERYDPKQGHFRFYLLKVTRSVLSTQASKKPVWTDLCENAAQQYDDEWEYLWKREAFRRAINVVEQTVSIQARQILNLTLRGNCPNTIAGSLGLSIEAVYKARQRLRSKIIIETRRVMMDT